MNMNNIANICLNTKNVVLVFGDLGYAHHLKDPDIVTVELKIKKNIQISTRYCYTCYSHRGLVYL